MSVKDHLLSCGKGFVDSLKGPYWLYTLDRSQRRAHNDVKEFKELRKRVSYNREEPNLVHRVLQCCTLNGFVFGLSIILFNHVLLPVLQTLLSLFLTPTHSTHTTFWSWLQFLLQWTFGSLWVLPLFVLSRIVNALWFQDIGTLAYRYSQGRPKTIQSLSTFIADNLFSLIIQALFLIQAMTLQMLLPLLLPKLISTLVFHLHTCLLYSLYSFEYKWVQMGMPLHQRLSYLESNWPYFIGFGLPLSLLTYWSDFVISGCLFAIFFPIFIISGNEAEVVQWRCPHRLQIFSFVVHISNSLFNKV